jgi:hypothetical protein
MSLLLPLMLISLFAKGAETISAHGAAKDAEEAQRKRDEQERMAQMWSRVRAHLGGNIASPYIDPEPREKVSGFPYAVSFLNYLANMYAMGEDRGLFGGGKSPGGLPDRAGMSPTAYT